MCCVVSHGHWSICCHLVLPIVMSDNFVDVQFARDFYEGPCLGCVESVKPLCDSQVAQLVSHVASNCIARFVAFFCGAAGDGEDVDLSQSEDKAAVGCFPFVRCMLFFGCVVVVSFEMEAWFMCAALKPFLVC